MRRQRCIVLGANFNTDKQKDETHLKMWQLVQTQPSLREIYESSRSAIIGSGATTRYEAAICGLPVLKSATPKHDNACKTYEKFNCAKFELHKLSSVTVESAMCT